MKQYAKQIHNPIIQNQSEQMFSFKLKVDTHFLILKISRRPRIMNSNISTKTARNILLADSNLPKIANFKEKKCVFEDFFLRKKL